MHVETKCDETHDTSVNIDVWQKYQVHDASLFTGIADENQCKLTEKTQLEVISSPIRKEERKKRVTTREEEEEETGRVTVKFHLG